VVKYNATLDDIFFALSNSTRRRIIEIVCLGPVATSELAFRLGLTLPALHKHTNVLLQTRIISKTKKGRVAYLVFNPLSMLTAIGWLESHEQYFVEVSDEQVTKT
jgi:DNA-binding transcriptional ArsR family regulator